MQAACSEVEKRQAPDWILSDRRDYFWRSIEWSVLYYVSVISAVVLVAATVYSFRKKVAPEILSDHPIRRRFVLNTGIALLASLYGAVYTHYHFKRLTNATATLDTALGKYKVHCAFTLNALENADRDAELLSRGKTR
jgi:hypothetical protein